MADFKKEIYDFQQNGTYTYKYDSVGNMVFDSSSADFSQVYVSFPLINVVYKNQKLDSIYDTDFKEFVPTSNSIDSTNSVNESLIAELEKVKLENDVLTNQLNGIIAEGESNSSVADKLATKQVILELRKSLGEGRVDSDFSEEFPYTPIKKVDI